jgi:2-C-methyl-D-erythritol 4-phosphate cytidylyltransferase
LGADVPKAFVHCAGRELWEWSADVLVATCDRVVMAVPAHYLETDYAEVERVVGGDSRSESVRNALAAEPEADIVVIHDAARPLVTGDLVGRCISTIQDGADGAVAAARVTDTIKQADDTGRVVLTLDRDTLWSIQTPQAFRSDVLRQALDTERIADATDDATLVEALGGEVRIVEAPAQNFKITWPEDLERAEALL